MRTWYSERTIIDNFDTGVKRGANAALCLVQDIGCDNKVSPREGGGGSQQFAWRKRKDNQAAEIHQQVRKKGSPERKL